MLQENRVCHDRNPALQFHRCELLISSREAPTNLCLYSYWRMNSLSLPSELYPTPRQRTLPSRSGYFKSATYKRTQWQCMMALRTVSHEPTCQLSYHLTSKNYHSLFPERAYATAHLYWCPFAANWHNQAS